MVDRRPAPELEAFLSEGLVRRRARAGSARRPVELELGEARLARTTAGPTLAWLGSVALHAGALGVTAAFFAGLAGGAPGASLGHAAATTPTAQGLPSMSIELEASSDQHPRATERAPAPRPGGLERAPRPDTGRDGLGGAAESAPAWNLAHQIDGVTLSRDQQSRLDRSQIQRTRDGDTRETTDPRRAMAAPMELTFVVVGAGAAREARPARAVTPAHGARDGATEASAIGGDPRPRPHAGEGLEDPGAAVAAGTRSASPAIGVLSPSVGAAHTSAADVATQRPQVIDGRPANPSSNLWYRSRDTADSPQEASNTSVSLLNASAAGGVAGVGAGGEHRGSSAPGVGGVLGEGSRAAPNGHGGPGAPDPDPLDRRLSDYRRRVTAKIDPLWNDAFPRWAALEGRQGRAIIHFTIKRDGTIDGATVVRSSGIPEFDENVRRAVLRAAPFGPLPDKLGATLPFYLSFDSPNPVVR